MEPFKHHRLLVSSFVVVLGLLAFSLSIAAEFKKVEAKDMKLDGSLCTLPGSLAFGFGIASIACLSIAQIVGTSTAVITLCSMGNKSGRRNKTVSITFLLLSWVSFGLAAILSATGSSMNGKQPYGKGWMDGECYVVKDGVFIGAAVLNIVTVIFIVALIYATRNGAGSIKGRTSPVDQDRRDLMHDEHKGGASGTPSP